MSTTSKLQGCNTFIMKNGFSHPVWEDIDPQDRDKYRWTRMVVTTSGPAYNPTFSVVGVVDSTAIVLEEQALLPAPKEDGSKNKPS